MVVAPLRERRDDVLPLAMRLLESRCRPGERIPALSADAAHALLTYRWPGNVRELDNVMQRALILCSIPASPMSDAVASISGPIIQPEHIQFENGAVDEQPTEDAASLARMASPALADSLELAEQELILEALRSGNGNRQTAATKLGISPRTLRYKLARLRDLGVSVPAA
jgi:two-component system response regulator FlrC